MVLAISGRPAHSSSNAVQTVQWAANGSSKHTREQSTRLRVIRRLTGGATALSRARLRREE